MNNSDFLLEGKVMVYKAGNSNWYYKYQEGKVFVKKDDFWVESRNKLQDMDKYELKILWVL